ncbi:MAG: hypothetical protein KDA80_05030, partial [Planctomycetaceae bacterium]|nr:hypothetical protein [Planctomycetaceae bacterium]
MSGSPSSSSGDQLPKKHFQVGRVLAAVFGIAVVGGVIFGMVEYINGMPATLVPASGRVTWDGQPVTIGAVMTQHVDDPFQSAIGAFDEEGRFELMTNGQPGAALGTHKVIVASYGPGMGTSPLVPQEYLKAESSPLSITISSDPQKNVFELEVIGEAPKSPQRGGGAGPPGGSPGGGNQGGGN